MFTYKLPFKKILTALIKKHKCLYTLSEQFDASPGYSSGYERSDIPEKMHNPDYM